MNDDLEGRSLLVVFLPACFDEITESAGAIRSGCGVDVRPVTLLAHRRFEFFRAVIELVIKIGEGDQLPKQHSE